MQRLTDSSTPTRVLGALSALTMTLVVAGADAQPAEPSEDAPDESAPQPGDEATERAREHYQRGVQFYRTGDDKLALVEFRRAYELSKNYRILFNIGRVNQQLNQYADALTVLERYLHDGGDDIPAERRLQVQGELDELRRKTAQIAIVVNVPGADLRIDGVPIGRSPTQALIRVDAGDHHVEARRSGYQSAGRVVTVAGRDIARVSLALARNKPVVAPRPTPTPSAPPEPPSTTPLWIGWVSTGAFAAGAGVMGGLAASRANELEALRDSPTSSGSDRETVADQARRYAIAADVLTAAAVVAGGTSLFLSLSRGDSSREVATPSTRAGLCGTGLCLTGEF